MRVAVKAGMSGTEAFREVDSRPERMNPSHWSMFLLVSWLLCASMVSADIPGDEISTAPSVESNRFSRTVKALGESNGEGTREFAVDALIALAEIYYAESDLARYELDGESPPDSATLTAKLSGWSLVMSAYAEQLLTLSAAIEQGATASIVDLGQRALSLKIDDQLVMISHPRPAQQARLEQQILAQYCRRRDCKALTAEQETSLAPIPVSAAPLAQEWAFTTNGPVCRAGPLRLQFSQGAQLGSAKALCAQLSAEIASLRLELEWQQRHGVAIDYDALEIAGATQTPDHTVSLNSAGDSVLLPLPLLFSSEGLLIPVAQWLRMSLNADAAQPQPELRLEAAQYGWDS
ncbi:MAG: hypothetical protein HRT76_13165 [Halieaceae bacterium]|nr:hypothetical protein [Halieaceae bacterium]